MQLNSFPTHLKRAGPRTATLSSFAQRHSAFHWYAGFDDAQRVPGAFGLETADQMWALSRGWLDRNGREDNRFLHVHLWDPHTPYRAPASYGDPFRDDPLPAWLTEEVRAAHWRMPGPHSAQECNGFAPNPRMQEIFPRQPQQIPDMHAVRQMFDGYDTGVRYADDHVGRLMNQLADLGIDGDTAIMISSDHGETLGELNVYGDHQSADQTTTHVPMILYWPGADALHGRTFDALHYQIDVSATILALLGVKVPETWEGQSFAESPNRAEDSGWEYLVLSQGAWTCQRGVRWDNHLLLQTLHDGYHCWDDVMLFDLAKDPHETTDIAGREADVRDAGLIKLAAWHGAMMKASARGRDPLRNVIREGGPYHVRGRPKEYLQRLRSTRRSTYADALETKFAGET